MQDNELKMIDTLRIPSSNSDLVKGIEGLKSPASVIKRILANFEADKINSMEAIWNALLINKRSLRHGELLVEYEKSTRQEIRGFWNGENTTPRHFWYYNGNRYFILMEHTLCVGVTASGKEEAKDIMSSLKEAGIKAKLGGDKLTCYQYVSKIDFKNVDFSSPLLEMTKLNFKELGLEVSDLIQKYFNIVEKVNYDRKSPII